MLSVQETKEILNISVAQIFLELLAIIFDTFLFEHTVFRKIFTSETLNFMSREAESHAYMVFNFYFTTDTNMITQ